MRVSPKKDLLQKESLFNIVDNLNRHIPVKFQHQGPAREKTAKWFFEKSHLLWKSTIFSEIGQNFTWFLKNLVFWLFLYNPLNDTLYSSDFQHHLTIIG